jgi:hypothetical protein
MILIWIRTQKIVTDLTASASTVVRTWGSASEFPFAFFLLFDSRPTLAILQDPEMNFVKQEAKQWDVFGAETGGLFPSFTVSEQSKS